MNGQYSDKIWELNSQNGGMAQSISKIVAHSLLLASSLVCLRKCSRTLKYARCCFQFYIIFSIVSLFNCAYENDTLNRFEDVAWVWSYTLGLPLLATDLSIMSPYVPDISPLHLVVPVYTIIAFHAYPEKLDSMFLALSHLMSVMFLAANTICDGNISGFALSFLHFYSIFRLDSGINARTNWTFLMAISNFLSLGVIMMYF